MCINLSFYNVSQLLNALSNIAFDIANILTCYIFINNYFLSHKWLAVQRGAAFFVDHSVAEKFLVGKVAIDVAGLLGVVVFAFFVDVAEGFDGDAVLVLEDGVEQGAVGVAARMSHDIDLERAALNKTQ